MTEEFVPKKLTKPVLRFCRLVVADQKPVYVGVKPLIGEPINECFSIVPKHVLAHGGEQLNGWAVWMVPKTIIEAEFHAVWKMASGELVDISPRENGPSRILFIPDPRRDYMGRQVDNIRKALSRSKDILRLIELRKLRFKKFNEGALRDYHGSFLPSNELLKIINELEQVEDRVMKKAGYERGPD